MSTAVGLVVVTLGMVLPRYLAAREGELRLKSFAEARRYMCPAWRAAAVAYRIARGEGHSHDPAQGAAEAALQALHPELTRKQASDEAIQAVAYASSFHSDWFWAPLRKRLAAQQ